MPADITREQARGADRGLNAVIRRSQPYGGVVRADLLRERLRALLKAPGAPTHNVLALRSGVAPRTVSRVLNGHARTTRFDIADALLVALDATDQIDDLELEPAGGHT
jgi:hypothetical protein